ncbi:MAG: hypothetical protein OEU46_21910, partial [Alphaproteobacteria bacterium]|nr:hypothetical protein [Alphaproteobacteria bacterium]
MAGVLKIPMTPEQRARTGNILKSIGIFDVFLGAVAFLGGPSFIDLGPGREWSWPLIGLIIAISGVAV